MVQRNNHTIELMLFLAGISVVLIGLYYLNPVITGLLTKEFSYEDEPNLVITSNGNYTWHLSNIGELKSLKIDGMVTIYGKARVYLESNGIKYLVFDSTTLNLSEAPINESNNLITGLAVKEDKQNKTESDEDKKKKNNKPDWTSGIDEFVINETTTINLSLEVVDLIVIVENITEPINITPKVNHAPKWVSDVDTFILNKTLTIGLLQYFTDEDNDTLTFSVSDANGVSESISGNILTLITTLDHFKRTLHNSSFD